MKPQKGKIILSDAHDLFPWIPKGEMMIRKYYFGKPKKGDVSEEEYCPKIVKKRKR